MRIASVGHISNRSNFLSGAAVCASGSFGGCAFSIGVATCERNVLSVHMSVIRYSVHITDVFAFLYEFNRVVPESRMGEGWLEDTSGKQGSNKVVETGHTSGSRMSKEGRDTM